MTKPYPSGLFESPGYSGGIEADEVEGEFEIALNPIEKASVRALMRASGVDNNVRTTLRQIAGDGFTADELKALEDRVLDKANSNDVKVLWGIEEGVPVVVSPNQKAAIDGLMGRLGTDPLAQRARKTYEHSLQGGRIRVR